MTRMGTLFVLCIVLAAVLVYRAADSGSAPPDLPQAAAPPNESTEPTIQLSIGVRDSAGLYRTIRTAPDVDVVVMATWCPYSGELKGFLTDSEVRPYLTARRLVFLFERSEWPRLQRLMAGNEDVSPEQARRATAAMQRQRSGSPFADESFFRDLPGEVYFVDDVDALGFSGFPSFYSDRTARFDLNRTNWAVRRLGMERQLARDLMGRHEVR